MTAEERLLSARIKAKRAEFHITNVEAEIKAFHATNPHEIRTKRNAQTRQLIYYMERVTPPQAYLSATIGDALFNLRSALDHLAQQFYLYGTGSNQGSPDISFPIYDDAAKYKAGAPGKVKGMRQDAIDFIDAAKPYKGGNDALWRLHKLNNIDKHRLLITCGGSFSSVNIGAHLTHGMADFFGKLGGTPPKIDLFVRPADTLCPLKAGDELFIDAPDAEPDLHMEFKLDVSLYEPQILEAQPVAEVLRELSDTVNRILDDARPLLA